MTVIGKCAYDRAGRLVRPTKREISDAKFSRDFDTGGSALSFDRGFTHVAEIHVSGTSAAQARARAAEALQRFFDRAEFTPGYRKISVDKRAGILPINDQRAITYEIVYAVELPSRSRGPIPGSPDAGPSRDPEGRYRLEGADLGR